MRARNSGCVVRKPWPSLWSSRRQTGHFRSGSLLPAALPLAVSAFNPRWPLGDLQDRKGGEGLFQLPNPSATRDQAHLSSRLTSSRARIQESRTCSEIGTED
ncbi:hypothetical protein KM043_006744 [Ampulex compressa]|nr:hypothetical protein KM043_006744 [Ampulex compressa]